MNRSALRTTTDLDAKCDLPGSWPWLFGGEGPNYGAVIGGGLKDIISS
jgi:hypothetical protein